MKQNRIPYFERSYSWVLIVLLPLYMVGMALMFATQFYACDLIEFISCEVAFTLCLLLTYKMDIICDGEILLLVIGVGIIKKRIYCENIQSVRTVKIPGRHKGGIKVNRMNMASYCFRFFSRGVEIEMKSGRIHFYVIGTKNPEMLAEYISKNITENAKLK